MGWTSPYTSHAEPRSGADAQQPLTWQRMYRLATQWLPESYIMHPYPAQRLRVTTRGKSPVQSCRTPGSVRGVPGNRHPYRDL